MADSAIAQQIVSELPANIGGALALVPTLEWAKRSALPWLTWVSAKTAPAISVIAAAALAAGIHGTWHSAYDANTGTWIAGWTWTGLTLLGVTQAGMEVGKQWLGQHWTYRIYQTLDAIKSVAVAVHNVANVSTSSITDAGGVGSGHVK